MGDNPSIRLNKVLRELNISLDRVVEFLSIKGFQVEPRPTTKISEEIHNILLEEFKTDKSKRDASNEITEEKKKEKESNLPFDEEKGNEIDSSIELKDKIKGSNFGLNEPVKAGKIDVDSGKVAKELSSKSGSDPLKENLKIEKPTKDSQKEFTKEASVSKDADIPEQKDQKTNGAEHIKTEYKVLSGPKGVGKKINLDDVKKKENNVEEARKRRRKRISKETNKKESQNNLKTNNLKSKTSNRKNNKDEVSDEDVQKQVRETLEKLQGKSSKSKGAKYRKDKRDQHRQKSEDEIAEQEAQEKTIQVTEFITVGEVATLMEVNINEIISACMSLGIMVTMNQRLDAETLSIVADEFGYKVDFVKADLEEEISEHVDKDEELLPRPPIVTVMGHVDHGKTSLLDYIREENVIAGESGGITQHIGAYSVTLKEDEKITFLDTPGHEAFTAMRARGAQITDIAIIVIAADDSIMPQTKEAISHAQAAGVPIIFAINKIDKSTSNPEKIKEELAAMNFMVEDWGGKIQSQDISALKGNGVNELLEKVLLEAEML
ncbi:MAG: translation initiation factor IF-2 N-terminal domain-containing protein, partial [Flavobacteriaceae bacterium]|nr:translation initiation factor IF-2 N-terminal domain-containing protein [Flavobacteriaceae bacterium]